jgi:hypothetical protein
MISARQFGDVRRRIERGDPIAIYEAIHLCKGAKLEMPPWLADELMKVIADFHLGNKPSWKKDGIRPLSILRRRIEMDVKRRAVASVRAWQKDKTAYSAMPGRCIKAWYRGWIDHGKFTNYEDALILARFGIRGLRIEKDRAPIKCGLRTLRRAHEMKSFEALPPIPSDVAKVFGLNDPDQYFGTDKPPPLHLLA